jgi:phospholipase C
MIVISPWSKGGWVNSEVLDHTSLIRFIERRFGSQYPGLQENNITKWRRAVIGDLTSAFNFASPNRFGSDWCFAHTSKTEDANTLAAVTRFFRCPRVR